MLTELGGRPGTDRIAGFIYIGEKIKPPIERTRPDGQSHHDSKRRLPTGRLFEGECRRLEGLNIGRVAFQPRDLDWQLSPPAPTMERPDIGRQHIGVAMAAAAA